MSPASAPVGQTATPTGTPATVTVATTASVDAVLVGSRAKLTGSLDPRYYVQGKQEIPHATRGDIVIQPSGR
jgi:hypothetical protein